MSAHSAVGPTTLLPPLLPFSLLATESQLWCGLARSNEAAASGLRATLDALLLRASVGGGCGTAHPAAEEGFGESGGTDDTESCCFVDAAEDAMLTPTAKWACDGGEASVLLPCRHLCMCKACEPRTDACPVCSDDLAAYASAVREGEGWWSP
ncbi:probable BOI-related E3 ubiquitin-protein ligase 3 [Miscanthus floridulus]|uniref:probable BOI-related E3 ubiquitin-protein ligase 3 n=1 Tax=Miscanthus floridulus TaxID=154761 RepID=UPI00345B10AF